MPSKRKFYRTVYTVEVLSEDPLEADLSLEDITYEITTGNCSGKRGCTIFNEEVDGPTMAKLLRKQDSDPNFFLLNDDGYDVDETGVETASQHYENGECPDCGDDIADYAGKGDECDNCGHVFTWGPDDDQSADDPALRDS
jgi:hypothetical protein